ncbi:hypothetical protein J3R30DRAFT_3703390 [Lentinula aciculospora]|uniref:F-box domain-containing protein n=1 Tax=Lentinula aciculospora TaxID=153920 RepID=A0A9W9A9S8_9AGAR|nr:hypothetical protein J3R30DRAFT_3703390 [Lentinula aciculospora]
MSNSCPSSSSTFMQPNRSFVAPLKFSSSSLELSSWHSFSLLPSISSPNRHKYLFSDSLSSPKLPPELTDYIIDYCHADKNALLTCSLVSRSFNATCRYHLFGKGIDISNTPKIRRVKEEVEHAVNEMNHNNEEESQNRSSRPEVVTTSNINPASSAASFLRIVIAPSSTVAPFLQELSLVLRPLSSSYSTPTKPAAPPNAWLDDLLSLLPGTEVMSPPSYNGILASAPKVSVQKKPLHLRTLRIFRHGVDLSPFSRVALHQAFAGTVTTLALFETTLQQRSLKRDIEWVCGFEKLEDLLFYGHHRGEKTKTRRGAGAASEGGIGDAGDMDDEEFDTTEAESPWGWTHPQHEHKPTFDLNDAPHVVDGEGRTTIRLPRSVRRLRLDLPGPALDAVMRWLLAHGSNGSDGEVQKHSGVGFRTSNEGIPHVSVLHIFRVMDDEMPALRAYLHACKDTLQDLMMFLYQGTTNRDDFNFSSHTALRSLYLASNGSKPMKVLHDILSTLSTSPSRTQMQKIYLQIPRWQLASDDDAWNSLDSLLKALLDSCYPSLTSLSRSNLKNLKVSAIVDEHRTYNNGDEEDSENKLRVRLPLSTSFMSPSVSSDSSMNEIKDAGKNGEFTMINIGAKEVAEYVDEVYGRMRTF